MAPTELTGFARVVDRLQSVGGVAAGLATMITATVCLRYLLWKDAGNLPPDLGHALSLILGFYFGSFARGSTTSAT